MLQYRVKVSFLSFTPIKTKQNKTNEDTKKNENE